ncbi:hypothetical protein ACQKQD_18000 [Methylobacterium sp. NPDC080182]|uniref:hypothetical protein n=1 Tax=Methylobacterium sp. NPDC080182 TaxID=3390590 RepID=UPI003D04FDB4
MKFRPASAVARDLLRLSTPKALRPKRITRSKRPNASIDLPGIPVLHVRQGALVLTLTPSFKIAVGACATDALRAAKVSKTGALHLPFAELERGPVLVVNVPEMPAGVQAGTMLDVRARFEVDVMAEIPTVTATATRISLSIPAPRKDETEIPASITLPSIGGPPVTDESLGLPPDPDGIAQQRAERFLTAAIAFRNRRAA